MWSKRSIFSFSVLDFTASRTNLLVQSYSMTMELLIFSRKYRQKKWIDYYRYFRKMFFIRFPHVSIQFRLLAITHERGMLWLSLCFSFGEIPGLFSHRKELLGVINYLYNRANTQKFSEIVRAGIRSLPSLTKQVWYC